MLRSESRRSTHFQNINKSTFFETALPEENEEDEDEIK